MRMTIIAFVGFIGVQLSLHAVEIPTTRAFTPMIGQGYLNERQALLGDCLSGTSVFEGSPEASVAYTSSISEQQLASELGISAGGKARLGVTQVSASASFYNASHSDAFSISAIYTGSYFFKNRIFKSPLIKAELVPYVDNLNIDKWREACGDEFIVQQSLGAKLYFSIRIDFLNEQERNAFAANFSFDAPFVSANASVSHAMSGMSRRTKVTINVLQIGGRVERVTEIFQGQQSGQGGTSQAFGFVQCSSGKLDKCSQVLEQAISYATDTRTGFPSQISPDFLANPRVDGGPAVLSNTTQSYRAANIFFDITPELDAQMKLSRQLISQKYERAYAQYSRARRLVRDGVIRLSPRQRDKFTAMESHLFLSLQKITESSLRCYQYPKQCGAAYSDLAEALPEGIKLYEENDFLVAPETFAQYCDLGQSPLSQKALSNTVVSMVEAARDLAPELFIPPYEGGIIDTCSAAELAFASVKDLKLTGRNIEDLRPIAVLSLVKRLSLRGNQLSSLSGLAAMINLEYLDIGDNKLTDVSEIESLDSLVVLDLSDNYIEDVSSFHRLTKLRRLDLRNNKQGIRCPFPDQSRCVIADFRNNNSFIGIAKNSNIPRIAHAAAVLSDGRLLFAGGKSLPPHNANRAEVFNPRTGSFDAIGELVHARYLHTATTMSNGDVLLVGGFGQKASASAELFKSDNQAFYTTNGAPKIPRAGHTATLLSDGRVLIIGGWSNSLGFYTGIDASNTVEIYEPVAERFVSGASMSLPRAAHTATLLNDGRVLVTGGHFYDFSANSAEIYDPVKNRWQATKTRMKNGRGSHTATLLDDGKIFLAGGFDGPNGLNSAEIFDPSNDAFIEVSRPMNHKRGEHQSLLLADGNIILFGGRQVNNSNIDFESFTIFGLHGTAEIFDPNSQLFTTLPKRMTSPRAIFSATMFHPNRAILVGGIGGDANYSAEIFEYGR